jgi:Outer membrane protein
MKKVKASLLLLFFSAVLVATPATYAELSEGLLANSTELRKSYVEYQKSLLDTKEAKGAYSPTIEAMMSATYMANPPIGKITMSADELMSQLNYPAGMPRSTGYLTLYDGMPNTMYNASITLTQPIFTWGKIGTGVKLREKAEEVRYTQITDTEARLFAELKTRLCAIYYLGELKKNLAEQETLSSRLIELTESARDAGLMLEQDVLEVKMQARQINLASAEIDGTLTSLYAGLASLTGLYAIEERGIDYVPDVNEIEAYSSQDTDLLISYATSSVQPTLHMLDTLSDIANLKSELADKSIYWKPDLALQVSASYGGTRFPGEKGWYQNSDWGLNVTVALKTTVWDGGKKMYDIDRASFEEESARTDRAEAVNRITSTIREAKAQIEVADARIEYATARLDTAAKRLELTKKQYELGAAGEDELIKKKLEMKGMEAEILQAEASKAEKAYTLAYLSGISK